MSINYTITPPFDESPIREIVGETLAIEVLFTDVDGDPYTPASVTATAQKPDGTSVSLSTTDLTGGRFRAAVDSTLVGKWTLQMKSDDVEDDVIEVVYDVIAADAVETGAIFVKLQQLMPQTWKKLRADEDYGDAYLQSRIESTKLLLLSSPPAANGEGALDPVVQEYLALRVAYDMVPTAIEFWSNIRTSLNTDKERSEFPDRIAALEKMQSMWGKRLYDLKPTFDAINGDTASVKKAGPRPMVDTEGLAMVTPDPNRVDRLQSPAWDRDKTWMNDRKLV